MERRRLGRTGHMSTITFIGGAAFWEIDQDGANQALDLAAKHGINHIDVAPQYGNAQAVIGPWLETRRDQFFLGCKTLERTRDAAWADLENSLQLLRTDHLDLYQFHGVKDQAIVDQITAPGGAAEAFIEARDQGIVRELGVTGHGMLSPRLQLQLLERLDLGTVMFPLNARLFAEADYRRDAEQLLQVARERDLGVMIIKASARAPWSSPERGYLCWYEPYDVANEIIPSLRYVLSQAGVTLVAPIGDVRLWPMIFEGLENYTPMTASEQTALLEQRANDVLIFDGPNPVNNPRH